MNDSPPPDREPIRPRKVEYLDSEGQPLEAAPQRRKRVRFSLSGIILGLCVLVFLVSWIILKVSQQQIPEDTINPLALLAFSPGNGQLFPQIITHMFSHADIWHLAFNMIVLYFFGVVIERIYGMPRFALLYFAAGVVAALAQAAVQPDGLLLGASGALAGVLAAFVRHFPHVRIYIWGVLPLPAWLAILLWLAYNLIAASMGQTGIAFTAHFVGFAVGGALSYMLVPPGSKLTWGDK